MRARFIYEKFTQNSDPIKDLGIGGINIYEKAQEFIHKGRGIRGLRLWLDYARTLIGKTITGKFIKGDHRSRSKKIITKTFKISKYNSYSNATTIVFYNEKKNPYRALKNEYYVIQ